MRGMVRVIVAGLTALALAPVGGMAAAQDAPPPVPVEAEKVRVETVERVVEAIGTLRASESVVLRPEIAGRITEFQFEEGQPVKAGQVLVRLDDEVYRAELAQAEANLRLSRANAARAQQLHREGWAPSGRWTRPTPSSTPTRRRAGLHAPCWTRPSSAPHLTAWSGCGR